MRFTGVYPGNWNGYVFLQKTVEGWYHEGIDYNYGSGYDDFGLDVLAITDATVEWISDKVDIGYGKHLFLKWDDEQHGTLYAHYCHLKEDSITVKIGDVVQCGQKIGECGNTGHKDMSPHLHFEIRRPIRRGYNFHPGSNNWDKQTVLKYYFDGYTFISDKIKLYELASLQYKYEDADLSLVKKDGQIIIKDESGDEFNFEITNGKSWLQSKTFFGMLLISLIISGIENYGTYNFTENEVAAIFLGASVLLRAVTKEPISNEKTISDMISFSNKISSFLGNIVSARKK